MKKIVRLLCLVLVVVLIFSLAACGNTYVCSECGKKTSKAYYDFSRSEDGIMCEDCAAKYWMPLDYETYRVK